MMRSLQRVLLLAAAAAAAALPAAAAGAASATGAALPAAAAGAAAATGAALPAAAGAAAGAPAAPAGLPPAPAACTADIIRSIEWGAGSCAAGIEGAARAGGRAPSVWDAAAWARGGDSPDVAIDFYNRFKGDVALMQQLGLKHLRLSLSWSRLLPGARKGTAPNPEAVRFYSAVLDALAAAGIQPVLVLYHWDLPQLLQDSYGGLLSPLFVDDYVYFADTAFRLFGRRVHRWFTFIEPFVICNQQYGNGQYAPGVAGGDAARFKCGHNLLLAHASAVRLYRQKYAAAQGGQLSFTTLVTVPEPASGSAADKQAAQHKLDAEVGWFLDPILRGGYPASLARAKGGLLPAFTPEQAVLLRGSLDFIAIAAFTSRWVWANADGRGWAESRVAPNGTAVGPPTGVSWMAVAPASAAAALRYTARAYPGLPLYVSSLGTQAPGEERAGLPGVLDDAFRVRFLAGYLGPICEAVRGGVDLRGLLFWSLFDGYEWGSGSRFGLVHVDGLGQAGGSLKRAPKASASWLSQHFFAPGG